jgi:hypothetical protein
MFHLDLSQNFPHIPHIPHIPPGVCRSAGKAGNVGKDLRGVRRGDASNLFFAGENR